MTRAACSPSDAVAHRYDRWLQGHSPVALYVRWYLLQRTPREYLRLLDAIGPPRARLLDVGCAAGVPLLHAYRAGWGRDLLAGVDVSTVALTRASETLRRGASGGRGISLERACADSLPFEDGSFGAVTCNGLVKYLDDAALERTLTEMRRVTATGGRIAIGEFGPRISSAVVPWWRVSSIEDQHLRSAEEVAGAISAAGFSSIERIEIPRIRRFPYAYIGVIATS